jgi:hypothetical protein
MPLVIAVWPNNTLSIIKMPPGFSDVSLFDKLDEEDNPHDARCYIASPDEDGLHITFSWTDRTFFRETHADPVSGPDSPKLRLAAIDGKLKKLKWKPDVNRRWLRTIARAVRHRETESDSVRLTASECQKYPAEPTAMFEVDAIRSMKPFCGVYFSFNEDGTCHYVGESQNVPVRVSKSRPEIGDRRIGFIVCDRHERKALENYFIAMLDPPGNASSTHAMLLKERNPNEQ